MQWYQRFGVAQLEFATNGDIYVQSGGAVNVLASGVTEMVGGAGGTIEVDASGNLVLAPLAGKGFGIFGASPVVQQTAHGVMTGFTAGSSTPVLADSTFTGGVGSTAYTIGDLFAAAKKYGWLVS